LRPLSQAITDRMDCSLNEPTRAVLTGGTAQPVGCFTPQHLQAWARLWGGTNHSGGDINANGYNEGQWGLWAGLDYAFDANWFAGIAGGYFQSDMNFGSSGGVGGGSINYSGGQIAGYGGYDNSVWYDRAVLSAGFYSGTSSRTVTLGNFPIEPSGTPDADAVSFYNEVGRRFWILPSVALTPFAAINVAYGQIRSFTESDLNNTGAALTIGNSNDSQTSTLLGARFNGTWGAFRPEAAVAWEHYFDTTANVNAAFAAAPPGSNFTVTSSNIGSDGVLVDAGLAYSLGPSSDLSVRYIGRFSNNYSSNAVMGRFTWRFGDYLVP
jgi:outer membrane autotransporter protein